MKKNTKQQYRAIRLNDVIKVKLTVHGEMIYFVKTGFNPVKDDEGYTKFALWKFMDMYGSFLNTEGKNVIDGLNLYILENVFEEVEL